MFYPTYRNWEENPETKHRRDMNKAVDLAKSKKISLREAYRRITQAEKSRKEKS